MKQRGEAVFSFFKDKERKEFSSVEAVDEIEKLVYAYLKPLGFRKFGRTLHRFVDGDISQVVNFQNGCPQKQVYGILWVNLGVRVPECAEARLGARKPEKKYYHEYECNIRTRLGQLVDGRDSHYNLKKDPAKIAKNIIYRLKRYAMPVFDKLNSRDNILKYRRRYPAFDTMGRHLLMLDEAIIYKKQGELLKAEERFNEYYGKVLAKYRHAMEKGNKMFLRKGETLMYRNVKTGQDETVVAKRNRFVTVYDANTAHLEFLEKLAETYDIPIWTDRNEKEDCFKEL